eukprot:CAMPEP_0185733818 /NCGR_PEP_ID=MMETSP1171-20130828/20591_1 /TAXON_ID=374046 /ORGANISM="Helicotheca tamensis, Strain CCMP826" /LENGTH=324 /DNA_ID=CAMNT_0028403639 /DNA_START=116 /DNA_END=1090 /DNA_ORIENTATION=-
MTKRLRADGPTLLWRLEPYESFSDWKIEIAVLGDDAPPETYHVHKVYLAAGPQKSPYFYGLFNSAMRETQENTTRISLQKSAAEAFPAFLDYMYTGDLNVTAENSIALCHLGDYFGVEPLKILVKDFIKKESTLNNICHFCKEALSYEDTTIFNSSMKRVAHMAPESLLSYSSKDNDDDTNKPVHELMRMLTAEQLNQLYSDALQKVLADKACLRIPYNIVVENAGNPEVNGVYTRDGMHKNDIKFSRSGDYNGGTAKFSIIKLDSMSGRLRWYLCIKEVGCFYCVCVDDNCVDVPPLRGWETSDEGRSPPPKLTFLFRKASNA